MKISKRLKKESKNIKFMSGTTAPTYWFDSGGTQSSWEAKRLHDAKALKKASKILKAAGL